MAAENPRPGGGPAQAEVPGGHGALTYDQAALALGVPAGTVRSRLSRARRKIREALDDIDSVAPEEHRHD